MLIRFDPYSGDLGRGERILPGDLPIVFKIISDCFKYLSNDNWSYGLEISGQSEERTSQILREHAKYFNVNLYEVDRRILFELRDKDHHSLGSIFYIIKVKE